MGEEIKGKYTPDEAYDRLARVCSRSETCESQLMRKMSLWNMPKADSEAVLKRLRSDGYVDNSRFAVAFARDKYRFDKWGPVKIKSHLSAKGIGAADIERAMEELDDSLIPDSVLRELSRKATTIKHKNSYELKSKLTAFLVRKGYRIDAALKAVGQLLEDNEQ